MTNPELEETGLTVDPKYTRQNKRYRLSESGRISSADRAYH
jgi:hypothetical protein